MSEEELKPHLSLDGYQILVRHRRMLEAGDSSVDSLRCSGGAQVANRRQCMFFSGLAKFAGVRPGFCGRGGIWLL